MLAIGVTGVLSAQQDTIVPFKKIHVADGFSPNGDLWNDELFVEAKLWPNKTGQEIKVDIKLITIKDSGGNVVYESSDATQPWNGMNGEEKCPMGTYYWTVTYSFPGVEEYSESGMVLLIR